MPARPTFSVVIASYEAEATVAEAIDSALSQTVRPAQIVVVDDGSPDNQHQVIQGYGQHIEYVRHSRNLGAPAAKDTAVARAVGEFVVILDADDVFLPTRLEAFADLLSASPDLDIVTSDAIVERPGIEPFRYYEEVETWVEHDQWPRILDGSFIYGEAAVRRCRWLAVGGMRHNGEDWPLWVTLIGTGSRAGLVPEPLVRYRLSGNTLSASVRRHAAVREKAMLAALRLPRLTSAERRLVSSRLREARGSQHYVTMAEAVWAGRRPFREAVRVLTGLGQPLRHRRAAASWLVAPNRARTRMTHHPDSAGL